MTVPDGFRVELVASEPDIVNPIAMSFDDHPSNPNHPSGWRADEQGLINPNVSALGDWTLAARQRQRFRYRLLVYRGSATREQLAARYESFGGDSRSAQDRP